MKARGFRSFTSPAEVNPRRGGDHLAVEVRDKGIGFETGTTMEQLVRGECFGLFGIQERLVGLGGQLDIQSQPGLGARVTLNVPLKGIAASD
ncbi:MAG: ATP-binding protein [Thermodesulfobacteriota bacterium]